MSVLWGRRPDVGREDRTATFGDSTIPLPGAQSRTFNSVDLTTAESGMQQVAIWACINYIVQKAISLPGDVYTGVDDAKREMPTPSWMDDPAGDGYGWSDWLGQTFWSALTRGNVYALPSDRDPRTGLPRVLPIVYPDQVHGRRDPTSGLPVWRVNNVETPRSQIWHQRAYVPPGGLLGMSPIAWHALTIGLGIQTERFGSQFFGEGAMPSGVLTNEEERINGKTAKVAKARFVAALRGSREPLVLGRGWKWQQISITPEESQFLETRGYSGAECCRIYGPHLAQILGYPTGDSLTYANRVDIQTSLQTDTLDPWLTWAERWISRTLLPKAWYYKFNRNALVRADLDARFKAYLMGIEGGFMTADEVRALEDWPALTPEQKAEIQAAKPQPPAVNPAASGASSEPKSAPIRVPAMVGPAAINGGLQ